MSDISAAWTGRLGERVPVAATLTPALSRDAGEAVRRAVRTSARSSYRPAAFFVPRTREGCRAGHGCMPGSLSRRAGQGPGAGPRRLSGSLSRPAGEGWGEGASGSAHPRMEKARQTQQGHTPNSLSRRAGQGSGAGPRRMYGSLSRPAGEGWSEGCGA